MRTAKMLVAYYYYVVPYIALLFVSGSISERQNFEPFWPLGWTEMLGLDLVAVVLVVKLLFVIVGILAPFLHRKTWVRFLVFVAIFQVHALESSFGSINHQWYLWLYTSLIFVFLPNLWNTNSAPDAKRTFLLYIWFAQATAMLTYSMAGMWKFYFAFHQYLAGEVHTFAMEAFAYQVANWIPRLQAEAILAPYIIEYPAFAWPFYAIVPFLQLFALWAMVRTSLQKTWALMLVLFHIGTFLTMGISFHPLVILIIILFFATPFAKEDLSFREFMLDLPVIGQILEWWKRRKALPQAETT